MYSRQVHGVGGEDQSKNKNIFSFEGKTRKYFKYEQNNTNMGCTRKMANVNLWWDDSLVHGFMYKIFKMYIIIIIITEDIMVKIWKIHGFLRKYFNEPGQSVSVYLIKE